MLDRFRALFVRTKPPALSFVHPKLGDFKYIPGHGWRKVVKIEGCQFMLYLGSDGEVPSSSMLDCLDYRMSNWHKRRREIDEYITTEVQLWPSDELLPQAHRLLLSSIEILWREKPWTCMIYLKSSDDDERDFHLTFEGQFPIGFAYDH
jgi:hypothetical protein